MLLTFIILFVALYIAAKPHVILASKADKVRPPDVTSRGAFTGARLPLSDRPTDQGQGDL